MAGVGRGGKFIDEETSQKFKEMRAKGFTHLQIADKYGCSETTVSNHVKGVVSIDTGAKGSRLTEEQKHKMCVMRKDGKTLEYIARELGCSMTSVKLHTKGIGVERQAGKVATKVRTLLKEGKSVLEVAAIVGCNRDYVYRLDMAMDNTLKKQKPVCKHSEELEKQKQLLKEKQQLREKELEELRQQEIRDFRWGGTVTIC